MFREDVANEVEYIDGILKPGAAMYRAMSSSYATELSQRLQHISKIPLLIAANLEKGCNGIATQGTQMGSPMQIAATNDPRWATRLGEVCVQEGSAFGVNWAFAPLVDIDYNFRNPITNTRTFGSNPKRVADMGEAYVRALQAQGLAASVKHFPGDGSDERDQHLVSSINNLSCEDWMDSYGAIYRRTIRAGVKTVMVGHIMQPAWSKRLSPSLQDDELLPASLSAELMNGLLRKELGFNGLIVTDATTMGGFCIAMPRRDAVPQAIAAGADMFLFALDLKEEYQFMLDGYAHGVITPERLDEAVTRILATKASLGLHRPPAARTPTSVVGCEQHRKWARECAEQGITLVKEQPNVLPLDAKRTPRILFYPIQARGEGFSQYQVNEGVCAEFANRLRKEGFEVTEFVPPQTTEGHSAPTTAVTERYDLIVYLANLSTKSNQTVVRIEWAQPMGSNNILYHHDVPTIFISVENPYHLLDVPRVRTYINTYASNPETMDALVDKLMGRSAFCGSNPVDPFCGKWDTHL